MSVSRRLFLPSIILLIALLCIPRSLWAEDSRSLLLSARNIPRSQAVTLLESSLKSSGELRPWYLLELARLEAEAGNWKKVLSWSILQTDIPSDIADSVTRWHAEALFRLGSTDASISLLKKRLDTGLVLDPQVYLAYFRSGKTGASSYLTKFDADFPSLRHSDPANYALSRYLSGICAVREGDWKQALSSFSRFSPDHEAIFPDLAPWSRYYLAYSQYRLGLWGDSVHSFTAYLDGWNSHAFSWQAATTATLAAIQANLDPIGLAERAVRLAPSGPELAESVLLKASILIDRKKYNEAEKILPGIADGSATRGRTALAPRAWFLYAEIAARQNKPAVAEERWLRIGTDFPRDSLAEESLFRSGENWFVSGNPAKAVELFERYRKQWPSGRFLDAVLRQGGEALGDSGNPDLGILWLEDYLKKFPKGSSRPQVYRALVGLTREKGEYSVALAHARAYLASWPEEAKLDDTEREIDELAALVRGSSPDMAGLHATYLRLGRSASLEGRTAGLRLARSWLADWNKRSDALDLLAEITKRSPKDTSSGSLADRNVFAASWALLGNALRESGDFRSAATAFLTAGSFYAGVDGERSAESLYGAVDSFLQSGMTGDAEKTLRTLEKNWPGSLWTRRASLLME